MASGKNSKSGQESWKALRPPYVKGQPSANPKGRPTTRHLITKQKKIVPISNIEVVETIQRALNLTYKELVEYHNDPTITAIERIIFASLLNTIENPGFLRDFEYLLTRAYGAPKGISQQNNTEINIINQPIKLDFGEPIDITPDTSVGLLTDTETEGDN